MIALPPVPVLVHTADHRGLTPAELAARCADRLVHVADSAPPELREQARAFKAQMTAIIEWYMLEAVRHDRITRLVSTSGA